MPIEIKITTSSGELLPATQELIQQRLESFAEANRRTKEVQVSVDDSDPAKPSAEVIAVIGTEEIAHKASASNTLEAVEAALGKIQRQRSQQLQERSDERKSEEDAADSDGGMKVVGGVAGILFAGLFAVIMARSGSCTYNPANYPETAPVTGTVTIDGQPVDDAMVAFVPSTGRSSIGRTDAQGNYELNYTGAIEGAMLGTHRVMIQKQIPDPNFVPTAAELEAFAIPPGVETPDAAFAETVSINPQDLAPLVHILPERYRGRETELSAEVEDKNNVFDFELSSDSDSDSE